MRVAALTRGPFPPAPSLDRDEKEQGGVLGKERPQQLSRVTQVLSRLP
jgi:hypothetical protein